MDSGSEGFDEVFLERQVARALDSGRDLADASRIVASIASSRAASVKQAQAAAKAAADALVLVMKTLRDLDPLALASDEDGPLTLRRLANAARAAAASFEASAAALEASAAGR